MDRKERRRRGKETNRKEIVDAAERLFFSQGYENTSMDQVAKEAEFSKRTVYVYFSGKEQIYFEVMIRGYRLLIGMVEESFRESRPRNALEEMRCLFFTLFRFSGEYPAYFKAMMEYETGDSDGRAGAGDEPKAECYRLGEQLFGYLSRALQKGAEEGSLPGNLETEKAALILWACAVGVFNTAAKKGAYLKNYHQIDPKEFIADSFGWIMRLIGGNGGDRREKEKSG